jgi:hypothetical protein
MIMYDRKLTFPPAGAFHKRQKVKVVRGGKLAIHHHINRGFGSVWVRTGDLTCRYALFCMEEARHSSAVRLVVEFM